jgi:phosphoesterase RecJ-like protein
VKCSLRSEGLVDVNAIAKQFNGGGHVRAAGCKLPGTVEDVEKQIVEAVTAAMR